MPLVNFPVCRIYKIQKNLNLATKEILDPDKNLKNPK